MKRTYVKAINEFIPQYERAKRLKRVVYPDLRRPSHQNSLYCHSVAEVVREANQQQWEEDTHWSVNGALEHLEKYGNLPFEYEPRPFNENAQHLAEKMDALWSKRQRTWSLDKRSLGCSIINKSQMDFTVYSEFLYDLYDRDEFEQLDRSQLMWKTKMEYRALLQAIYSLGSCLHKVMHDASFKLKYPAFERDFLKGHMNEVVQLATTVCSPYMGDDDLASAPINMRPLQPVAMYDYQSPQLNVKLRQINEIHIAFTLLKLDVCDYFRPTWRLPRLLPRTTFFDAPNEYILNGSKEKVMNKAFRDIMREDERANKYPENFLEDFLMFVAKRMIIGRVYMGETAEHPSVIERVDELFMREYNVDDLLFIAEILFTHHKLSVFKFNKC